MKNGNLIIMMKVVEELVAFRTRLTRLRVKVNFTPSFSAGIPLENS